MIPIGQSYRPSGAFEARGTLSLLILGAATAAAAAGLIWLWEISPLPTLLILTPIIQGALVGTVIGLLVNRLRMRNPLLAGLIGFACGLFSVALVHYGHHLRLMSQIQKIVAQDIRDAPGLSEADRRKALAELNDHPDVIINGLLERRTGWSGPIGTMIVRNQEGTRIKRSKVSGGFLWGLWGVEALLVAGFAAGMAVMQARQPFCEDCDAWCAEFENNALFPGGLAESVAAAVREDRFHDLEVMKHVTPVTTEPGFTSVKVHQCAGCDLAYATVIHRVPTGKKDEAKETIKAKALRITPEMTRTLLAMNSMTEPESPEAPAVEPPPESI